MDMSALRSFTWWTMPAPAPLSGDTASGTCTTSMASRLSARSRWSLRAGYSSVSAGMPWTPAPSMPLNCSAGREGRPLMAERRPSQQEAHRLARGPSARRCVSYESPRPLTWGFAVQRWLGGEDSNPQLQGQNLSCCRLHHPRTGRGHVSRPRVGPVRTDRSPVEFCDRGD